MGIDDLDDLLDTDFELEAKFRDLQAQSDLEQLKGGGRRAAPRGRPRPKEPRRETAAPRQPRAPDPLKDLKSALDGDAPLARYLLVMCPACKRKNRVPLERLRAALPVCGACKEDLAFVRV